MIRTFPLFLMTLLLTSCQTQHSVTTNQIVQTNDYHFGVKSAKGALLIDTIYREVRVIHDSGRQTLPPSENWRTPIPWEYYLVRNSDNQKAIFDSNGNMVFGFMDCFQLQLDKHTKTVVKTDMLNDNRLRSSLYSLDGELLFDATFENIGYINNSNLIALIAEDGQNEEYYLFNPFTNKKLGPYTHFNIYNQDSAPPMGKQKQDFDDYKSLNLITVRITKDNDYIWGVVDMQGNEVLPIEYRYIRILEKGIKERFIDRAEKPENVKFLFYSYKLDDRNTMLLFDEKMNCYKYDHEARKIERVR